MKIDYSEEHNPILRFEIDGYMYSFSLYAVEKDKHEWLAEVVYRQMQEVHDRACRNTTKQIQKGLLTSLGLEHCLRH